MQPATCPWAKPRITSPSLSFPDHTEKRERGSCRSRLDGKQGGAGTAAARRRPTAVWTEGQHGVQAPRPCPCPSKAYSFTKASHCPQPGERRPLPRRSVGCPCPSQQALDRMGVGPGSPQDRSPVLSLEVWEGAPQEAVPPPPHMSGAPRASFGHRGRHGATATWACARGGPRPGPDCLATRAC